LFYFILFFWIQRVNRARAYKMNSFSLFSFYLTGFRVWLVSPLLLSICQRRSQQAVGFVCCLFILYLYSLRFFAFSFRHQFSSLILRHTHINPTGKNQKSLYMGFVLRYLSITLLSSR
jgi:hypothetical protein